MNLLITGGAGFIGSRLANALLERGRLLGQAIRSVVLADQVAPRDAALLADARVQVQVGDLAQQLDALALKRFDGIFHLASAVSGECEADFDLGLRSNLHATQGLLEACRAAGKVPRFVFSSSLAVFGPDPALPLPAVIRDDTLPTPQSSYGVQKFVCEQLIADYTRKGYIDGRAVRLMTISVRPGQPNGAASSFLSGIIREPLAGLPSPCPVGPETPAALGSPARAVVGLIAAFEASREAFGGRTALNLPALTVTVQEMLDALAEVGGAETLSLVKFSPDAAIARLVHGWPARIDSARGQRLGLRADASFRAIVLDYVRDHPQAVTNAKALASAGGGAVAQHP